MHPHCPGAVAPAAMRDMSRVARQQPHSASNGDFAGLLSRELRWDLVERLGREPTATRRQRMLSADPNGSKWR